MTSQSRKWARWVLIALVGSMCVLPVQGISAQPESVTGAIVYDFGDRLELSDLDSRHRRLLVRTPRQRPEELVWSRDGSAVAIVREDRRRHSTDIYVANVAARSLRRVAHLSGGVTTPRWSPRGDRIAFGWWSLDECDEKTALYVADLKRNRLRTLPVSRQSDPKSQTFYEPFDWAPDGQRVLYGEVVWYKECELRDKLSSSLLHVGLDGKHPSVVRAIREEGLGEKARWSPNGLIAYSGYGYDVALTITSPNGRIIRRFSMKGFGDFEWSRRGDELYRTSDDDNRLVALRVGDGRRRTLFVYSPTIGCDGTKFCVIELTAQSPTGRFVLLRATDNNLDEDLFVVATDGTSRSQIADPAMGNSKNLSTAFFLKET